MSEITPEELSAYERLSPRQKAFVDAFLELGDSTEAARLCNYNQPRAAGFHLLSLRWVRRALKEKGAELGPSVAGVKEILRTLTNEMRTAEEPKDRIKAAELLGKRYAIFITRQELSGKNGRPIELIAKKQIDLSKLSDEELNILDAANRIIAKALPSGLEPSDPGRERAQISEARGEDLSDS